MKSRSISLPVVTLLAVVAMVLGSFSAATAAGVSVNQVKKLANKAITARAPGLTVAKAGSATNAQNAQVAATANSVAPDSITTNGVVNGTLTGSDIASELDPARRHPVRRRPDRPVGSRQLQRNPDLRSRRHGIGAQQHRQLHGHVQPGVTNCAAVVTPGNNDQAVLLQQPERHPVIVDMEQPDNTSTQFDTPFSLAVFC